MKVLYSREWAMPSGDTFSVPPIARFVHRYLKEGAISIDPFARNSTLCGLTNDLNPETRAKYHMEAREFLGMLVEQGVRANFIIFDPPYSPRQISDCYKSAGLTAEMKDTQNAALYGQCRSLFFALAAPGCIALSFGWNSTGMGREWDRLEQLNVCHGGAHNDTICLAERIMPVTKGLAL